MLNWRGSPLPTLSSRIALAWLRPGWPRLALAFTLALSTMAALGAPPEWVTVGLAHGPGWQVAPCEGDEHVSFAPYRPYVGQTVLIAVTSRRPHVGVWLSGIPLPTLIREREGQLGWVWDFVVALDQPGWHEFTNW